MRDRTLTDAERDVLRLLARNMNVTAISRELAISESAVNTRLNAAMNRMGALDRDEAVLMWKEQEPC